MVEKKFCNNCGIRLFEASFMSRIKGDTPAIFEFVEGFYCEKCAKLKVEERRK
jgi:hypothetical protein